MRAALLSSLVLDRDRESRQRQRQRSLFKCILQLLEIIHSGDNLLFVDFLFLRRRSTLRTSSAHLLSLRTWSFHHLAYLHPLHPLLPSSQGCLTTRGRCPSPRHPQATSSAPLPPRHHSLHTSHRASSPTICERRRGRMRVKTHSRRCIPRVRLARRRCRRSLCLVIRVRRRRSTAVSARRR